MRFVPGDYRISPHGVIEARDARAPSLGHALLELAKRAYKPADEAAVLHVTVSTPQGEVWRLRRIGWPFTCVEFGSAVGYIDAPTRHRPVPVGRDTPAFRKWDGSYYSELFIPTADGKLRAWAVSIGSIAAMLLIPVASWVVAATLRRRLGCRRRWRRPGLIAAASLAVAGLASWVLPSERLLLTPERSWQLETKPLMTLAELRELLRAPDGEATLMARVREAVPLHGGECLLAGWAETYVHGSMRSGIGWPTE